MSKRKASPEKKTPVKRRKVSDLTDRFMNSIKDACMIKGQKRKVPDDGEVPSSSAKKMRLLDHVHNDEDETRMSKRKVSFVKKTQVKRMRVSDETDPFMFSIEDACMVKESKQKVLDYGPSSLAKKMRLLDHVHKVSSSVDTSKANSTEISEGSTNESFSTACNRKATVDGKVSPIEKLKSPDQNKTKGGAKKSVAVQRREFKTKYVQQDQLGEGGFGAVFAGYRKEDNFPVAIKHVPKINVPCKVKDENGKRISMEVAALLKLAAGTPGSVGTSAAVSLLDWYDFRKELVLVMERPVPAMDLATYIDSGGSLTEETAKVILKQLVEAAKELEDKNIFHRDIKIENILIETGSDVPRVRLIDFGLSCFFKKRSRYYMFFGTPCYCPPEWFTHKYYKPGPTTVWQVGAVLYEALHAEVYFDTQMVLENNLNINEDLSKDCQHFLKMCLNQVPKRRPTLKELLRHPWLR